MATIANKVDKDGAKVLSDNNYTTAEKNAVATIANKVDKDGAKVLSDNNYTTAEKNAVATIGNKVDKETGKGLSTNDYTAAEKSKLSGIEAQANKTLIDDTLSNAGQAADAKAAGDAIADLEAENAFLREYLQSMVIYRTASGNPATFSDGYAANLEELVVTLTPTQSGSGDPSPTNVRAISGVSSVSVTRSGENGANSLTVTVPLVDSNSDPLTVYGGTLNVTTGELAVTAKYKTLAEWDDMYWHSVAKSFVLPVGDITRETPLVYSGVCSSTFKPPNRLHSSNSVIARDVSNHEMATQGGFVLYIRDDDYNGDVSAFKAAFGDAQIVYPLETPVTYQLTPAQVAALAGYNAVAADSGTISLKYQADPALAYDEIVNAILFMGADIS